jgi:hypothetical protein
MNSGVERWIALYIDALGWLYQWPRAFLIPLAIAAFAAVAFTAPRLLDRRRRNKRP